MSKRVKKDESEASDRFDEEYEKLAESYRESVTDKALEQEAIQSQMHELLKKELDRIRRELATASVRQSVAELRSDLESLVERVDKISALDVVRVASRRVQREEVPEETRKALEQLIAASAVSTSTANAATVPAVGDRPRPTPYLDAKLEFKPAEPVFDVTAFGRGELSLILQTLDLQLAKKAREIHAYRAELEATHSREGKQAVQEALLDYDKEVQSFLETLSDTEVRKVVDDIPRKLEELGVELGDTQQAIMQRLVEEAQAGVNERVAAFRSRLSIQSRGTT